MRMPMPTGMSAVWRLQGACKTVSVQGDVTWLDLTQKGANAVRYGREPRAGSLLLWREVYRLSQHGLYQIVHTAHSRLHRHSQPAKFLKA